MKGQQQTFFIDWKTLHSSKLRYGVPQGSVLGPLLFTVCTSLLEGIFYQHGVNIHMYADDTQIYITFKTFMATQEEVSVQTVEACICALLTWMIRNRLKLDDGETELLVITSPRLQSKLTVNSITVEESIFHPSTEARNLGVIFDHINMEADVTALTQVCCGHLCKISHVQRHLTTKPAEHLLYCFVTSRLDNGNSLLYGLPDLVLPETLQESDAMSTSVQSLKSCNWLPVKQWVCSKIMLMTCKVPHGQAPPYPSELIQPYGSHHVLLSSRQRLLQVPMTGLVTYGQRSLCSTSALRNSLPASLKPLTLLMNSKPD